VAIFDPAFAILGATQQTIYRHVNPNGDLRPNGEKLLGKTNTSKRQEIAP